MNPITIILFLIALLIFGWIIGVYNRIVTVKNQIDRAWANIDVILKQRADEIPNLVSVVEQYASYEHTIIDKLLKARENYGVAKNIGQKIASSNEISSALNGLIALGESNVELKANQNFIQLQSRVSELESTLADRRELYNEAVTIYNTKIEQIPEALFAGMLGFITKELFVINLKDRVAPSLKMKLPTNQL